MLLKMAAAPVAIVAGHTASQYYEKYLGSQVSREVIVRSEHNYDERVD
jgi:hypothetical protein